MSKDTYYWTCPYCGANLDPGESCDCRKEEDPADNYKLVQKGGEENVQGTEEGSFRVYR